ncbi:hypothetical protein F4803DRAFT_31519 [Xylaria telfairii]|nr:hypothetical protein F4803DRAFT_31519 [Xylaria telfairii]
MKALACTNILRLVVLVMVGHWLAQALRFGLNDKRLARVVDYKDLRHSHGESKYASSRYRNDLRHRHSIARPPTSVF